MSTVIKHTILRALGDAVRRELDNEDATDGERVGLLQRAYAIVTLLPANTFREHKGAE